MLSIAALKATSAYLEVQSRTQICVFILRVHVVQDKRQVSLLLVSLQTDGIGVK